MNVVESSLNSSQNQYRIDVSLTLYNLTLSYDERILQHQQALDLRLALEKAGQDFYAKSQFTPKNSQ